MAFQNVFAKLATNKLPESKKDTEPNQSFDKEK